MYCAGAGCEPDGGWSERMQAFRQIDKSANLMFVLGPVLFVIPRLRCLLISEKLESILSRWSCCHFF